MIEYIGWFGSLLFAICALPQAHHSWKNKNSEGITWGFLNLWFFGEVFTLYYILQTTKQAPLLANYFLNLLFLFVIIWYKIYPKKEKL